MTKYRKLEKRNSIWTKVCGLASINDVDFCIKRGVECIGLLLAGNKKSPGNDLLTLEEAKKISQFASGKIQVQLLVHSTDLFEVSKQISEIGPTSVQIQNALPIDTTLKLRRAFPEVFFFKTIHVNSSENFEDSRRNLHYWNDSQSIDGFLFDTHAKGSTGGTGKTHNWNFTFELIESIPDIPSVLAGGLNPENVANALKIAKPWGVDVMSGVSYSPGVKDHKQISEFIEQANSVPEF